MRESLDNDATSIVEDLTPEASVGGGLTHGRELLLGLALLLGVLAWSGWQWSQQEDRRNNYEAGQRAAGMQDWDEAGARFAAAGLYKDAPLQAAEAGKKAAERNKQYDAAVAYSRRGEWLASLQAARATKQIQHNFRDVGTMEANAEKEVYTQAVSGTVALRTGVQPQGLYYRAAGGWVWLKDSDRWSRVRGWGSNNHIVYDVASKEWTPPAPLATPEIGAGDQHGSPELKSRLLMVASLAQPDGKPLSLLLSLDPEYYSFYVWGEHGIWAFRYRDSRIQTRVRNSDYGGYDGSYDTTYEAFDSPDMRTISFPRADSTIVDIDRAGGHILYASPSDTSRALNLYVADADGSNRRLVYWHDGGYQSAQFSPDGRYVLATTYNAVGARGYEYEATVLVNLQSNTQPRTLHGWVVPVDDPPQFPPPLSATFISTGAHAGKVLVAYRGRSTNILSLVDPDDASSTLVNSPAQTRVDGSPSEFAWDALYQGELGVILAGFGSPEQPVALVSMGNDKAIKLTHVSLEPGESMRNLGVSGDRLVYDTNTRMLDSSASRESPQPSYRVYSLPISSLGSEGSRPTQVYSSTTEVDVVDIRTALLGPGLLAYLKSGELHARSYDGKGDVVLERGVELLYDLDISQGALR